MSKSSEGKPPKASRSSAKKTVAPLSESTLAADINSVKAPKAQSTAVKSTRSRKKVAPSHVPPSQDMIDKMIEEAAYFLAEKRHFAPGFEEQDWLEAKQQIMTQIEGANRPLK